MCNLLQHIIKTKEYARQSRDDVQPGGLMRYTPMRDDIPSLRLG